MPVEALKLNTQLKCLNAYTLIHIRTQNYVLTIYSLYLLLMRPIQPIIYIIDK